MAKLKVIMPTSSAPLIEEPTTIEAIKLTPQQEEQWGSTMSLMHWTCPGFRYIFYRLLVNNKGDYQAVFTRDIPVAATDAKNILINPDRFFQYNLRERVFIVGHEIAHNMYGDVEFLRRCVNANSVPTSDGTTLPFSNEIMQQAMDYRINPLLVDSKIGSLPRPLNDYHLCFDPAIGVANDSVIDVYKKLFKKYEKEGKIQYINMPGWILKPGVSAPGMPVQRDPQQWAVEMETAHHVEQRHAQGNMAGSLKRMFEKLLNPEVPWTDHVQTLMRRTLGNGSYNWRRPDRRFIVRDICMPSHSGKGSGWLVVWGDTSGSIGNAALCRYMAELSGIVEECHPKRLTVLWCDARIHRIDEVEDYSDLQRIHAEGVGGGGGTSVAPVMEWIKEGHDVPDQLICVTTSPVR